jgi:hypothetical protein
MIKPFFLAKRTNPLTNEHYYYSIKGSDLDTADFDTTLELSTRLATYSEAETAIISLGKPGYVYSIDKIYEYSSC